MNKLSFEEWFKDLNKNCISNIFSNGCDTEKCSECDNGTSARQAWNFCQKQNDEEIKILQDALDGSTKEDPFYYTTYCANIRYKYDEEIKQLKEQIEKLKNKILEFEKYISNKSDIIKTYDAYKNSTLSHMIDSNESLSQEFDDVFNSYKIHRDKEERKLKEQIKRMKNHFNCGAFRMSGKGHSEVACLEMVGCPCDKWKLKE